MRQAVGFGQVLKQILPIVFCQQASGRRAWKQRRVLQLYCICRLNRLVRSVVEDCEIWRQRTFDFFASCFRVAAHRTLIVTERNLSARAAASFGVRLARRFHSGNPEPAVMKTLARIPSSCNHLLLPSRMGEGGAFGSSETRIWVDVSVSSRISRTVLAPGICSVADTLVRPELIHGAFPLQKSCELSRNPCFPATLRRLPMPAPQGCDRNVREAGVIPSSTGERSKL